MTLLRQTEDRTAPRPLWFRLLPVIPLLGALWIAWLLWGQGGMARISVWAAEGQRDAQNAMAGTLRALRAGDPAALSALLGLCFTYGFFHAAGPGHGKILIGGYGLARRVSALRLAALALVSSLAQSASAVILVLAGVSALNLSREALVGVTEDWLAPASYGAIALIGLWLAFRGLRRLWRSLRPQGMSPGGTSPGAGARDQVHAHDLGTDPAHGHTHDHGENGTCECGHRHGPTVEEAENLRSFREAVLLIGAIAMRPCTGALFLMVLTWRMDILGAGIAGTFAIGLGVAMFTVTIALLSVFLRAGTAERLSAALPGALRPRRTLALLELLAGALIAIASGQLVLQALA
ncbi:nickel/cobalt transporter [Pseudooceanicola aestuarii]|uniref:nickel/cobalt transporter n=1 Tax=Pseudooceanicola aestuarii TaxID=2697319 RepID=UPI0013D28597|nr:hypothetical protein [Pseudooceanicola aestuarii]